MVKGKINFNESLFIRLILKIYNFIANGELKDNFSSFQPHVDGLAQ